MTIIEFAALPGADLVVDAVYKGGRNGNSSDDPFSPLLRVSNSGGFRYRGAFPDLSLLVLTTSKRDPNWPDELDTDTGIYTYYGDNNEPGRALHDTPRKGNAILSRVFEDAHMGAEERKRVPPIFLFEKVAHEAKSYRDVRFLGLAVPGTPSKASDDLVAVWRSYQGARFQNYRARLTVLDCAVVSRTWIKR